MAKLYNVSAHRIYNELQLAVMNIQSIIQKHQRMTEALRAIHTRRDNENDNDILRPHQLKVC